jgi:hypothetical protein
MEIEVECQLKNSWRKLLKILQEKDNLLKRYFKLGLHWQAFFVIL